MAARMQRKGSPLIDLSPDIEPDIIASVKAVRAAQTPQSLKRELELLTRPWGFDHRAATCPVVIFTGEHDLSLYYADIWAKELPNGRSVRIGGGHIPVEPASRQLIVSTWRELHGAK